jgi:multiple sugar transport system substrate-binding protein
MQIRKTKNLVLFMVLALIVGGNVYAGGAGQSSGGTASQQVEQGGSQTITFWHTYSDTEEAVFKNEVLPLWKQKFPNITVDAVRQDSGQYHQMLIISFGTGQSPDVARVDIVNTAAYAKQGGLVALSDFSDFTTLSTLLLEGPLSTNLYRGKYYGLPLDTNCKAAVINTNVLKNTLGITKDSFTMEEFIAAARLRGAYSLNVSGVGGWDMYPYFWLFGGVLTDAGFTRASSYLDSTQSVQAIQRLLELHDAKVFTIRDVDGSVDAWDGINSEYAMFFEGSWFWGAYEEKANSGIIASTIPTYEGRSTSVVGGENIVVFSTSKKQQAAYEFAKFMLSEEVQLAMLKAGQIPVLKSLVNNAAITLNPVWSVYMQQLSTGASTRIPTANPSAVDEIWSDAMNNIFVDKKDIQAELSAAAKLIDEQLAR